MKQRIERLKEVVRETAAEMIVHELSDPRIGFCTVTRVELANDLSHCTVHVSVLGTAGEKSRTMHGLNDARGLIQKEIARHFKTRVTPHLSFKLDDTIEKSFAVMEKIKEARASDPDAGKSPESTEKNLQKKSDNPESSFDLSDE